MLTIFNIENKNNCETNSLILYNNYYHYFLNLFIYFKGSDIDFTMIIFILCLTNLLKLLKCFNVQFQYLKIDLI